MTTANELLSLSKWDKGRLGESICKTMLASSGVFYIPLCDIENGSAPMAVGGCSKIVLPDFEVTGHNWSAYLDAKVKTQSIRWRKTGELRHGINKSNYEQYEKMGVLGNKSCGLFIVELLDDDMAWSGAILAESFRGLGKAEPGFNEPTSKVYWPRSRFLSLGCYSPGELVDFARGAKAESMDAILKPCFGPLPQKCSSHSDTTLFFDEPDRDRRGWTRTICRKCGAFIGYRPDK
jgi:hypothetical protein